MAATCFASGSAGAPSPRAPRTADGGEDEDEDEDETRGTRLFGAATCGFPTPVAGVPVVAGIAARHL